MCSTETLLLPQEVISTFGVLDVFNTNVDSLWQDFSSDRREKQYT